MSNDCKEYDPLTSYLLEKKEHRDLEFLIWKEFVGYAHDDEEFSKELEQDDFLCWTGTGKDCVKTVYNKTKEILPNLRGLDKKSRKKILKTLVKEYIRTHFDE